MMIRAATGCPAMFAGVLTDRLVRLVLIDTKPFRKRGHAMEKKILTKEAAVAVPPAHGWLDLEQLATVELTSEAEGYPIESALLPAGGMGWQAAEAGKQTIRLLFRTPLRVRHIRLVFCDEEVSRTQEFVLRWSDDHGRTFREIVRQQYNFSMPDSGCEKEEYEVDLQGLTVLELSITPDIGGGHALASLAELRLAE